MEEEKWFKQLYRRRVKAELDYKMEVMTARHKRDLEIMDIQLTCLHLKGSNNRCHVCLKEL